MRERASEGRNEEQGQERVVGMGYQSPKYVHSSGGLI